MKNFCNQIEIEGWSYDFDKEESFSEIIVLDLDSGKEFNSKSKITRNDVLNAYSNHQNIKYSGFNIIIPITDNLKRTYSFQVSLNYQSGNEVKEKITVDLATNASVFKKLNSEERNHLFKHIGSGNQRLISIQNEIKVLQSSLSWKITKPIRVVLKPFNLLLNQDIHSAFRRSIKDIGLFASIYKSIILLSKPHKYVQITSPASDYNKYIQENQLSKSQLNWQKEESLKFKFKPLISVIIPTFNTDPIFLKECINSVYNQSYENWELCIVDDASSKVETIQFLKSIDNPKVNIQFSSKNQHISISSNKAIKKATGDYIGLLDHDDMLSPDALFEVVKCLQSDNSIDIIYSDEDKIDVNGNRNGPYFKGSFNETLLLSNNYITHFLVVRKTTGDKIGWFRKNFEGAQDHDLILRLIKQSKNIKHISKILYHWRAIKGSTALGHTEKNYAEKAGQLAILDYIKEKELDGDVLFGPWKGSYRIKPNIKEFPKISIIIPFKNGYELLKKCVDSIQEKTTYKNFEIILVSNNTDESKVIDYINKLEKERNNIKVLTYNIEFNYSKINNYAVTKANGEYILLLNNDVEVISKGWLTAMFEQFQFEKVGAVGCELWYEDNTIQHYGIVTGIGGMAGHIFKGFPSKEYRHFLMGTIREVSAVTGACLLTKKKLYLQVNGLDDKNFKVALNDVDFCLKLRKNGYKVVFTPYSKLYHFESKSRGYENSPEKQKRFDNETKAFQDKWGDSIFNDPYYNNNLTLDREDYSLLV